MKSPFDEKKGEKRAGFLTKPTARGWLLLLPTQQTEKEEQDEKDHRAPAASGGRGLIGVWGGRFGFRGR